MRDILIQLATGVILMGMSAIGTACLGFISRFRKIKRDLNAAHQKIRRIERKLGYGSSCEGDSQPTSEDDF